MDSSVKTALTHSKESTPSELSSRLEDFVVKKVDTARIATFTLGKYAKSQSNADLGFGELGRSGAKSLLQISSVDRNDHIVEIVGSGALDSCDCREIICRVEGARVAGDLLGGFILLLVFKYHIGHSRRINLSAFCDNLGVDAAQYFASRTAHDDSQILSVEAVSIDFEEGPPS